MKKLSSQIKSWASQITLTQILCFLFFTWFVTLFLVYPNFNTIKVTFFTDGHFNVDAIHKLMKSERAVRSLKNSFVLACTLTFTVNLVGIFIVLVTDYFHIAGSRILKLAYSTTLIYGGVVLAASYKMVYGEFGFLTGILDGIIPDFNRSWFVGYPAVVLVMTFACTSNHIMFLSNAIKSLDYQTIEAARNMGASQWYILRRVVLPTLKPTLFALTILTFLTGLNATSAPLILGGKQFETITPMILAFSKSTTSRDLATFLALALGLSTTLLLLFMIHIERRGNYMSVSKVESKLEKQTINNPAINLTVHAISYLLFIIYTIPVAMTILFSFTNSQAISSARFSLSSLTLQNYQMVLKNMASLKPYLVSIVYAFTASLIVMVLCLLASRLIHKYSNRLTTVLEFSLLIPWVIPSTLVAMGLIVTFNTPQPMLFNLKLGGTVFLLLTGYIIIKIPFTLRMTKAVFFNLPSDLEEAGKNLGATSLYTFIRVLLPIILPSVAGVFVLNFIALLPDYDLSIFLFSPLYKPLGIIVSENTNPQSSGDARAMALVYSVILMIISTLALYLVNGRKNRKGKKHGY
ncbi:ABC transporter permease [Lacrimispora brassicae]